MNKLLTSLLLLGLAAACRHTDSYQTVPMPAQDVDLEQPSRARVYIVRSGDMLWQRVPLEVYSGVERIGSLGPGAYLCWEREPGRVLARLILERPDWEGGPLEQLWDARLSPGQVSWVRVRFDQGEQRLVPEVLDEEAGRALVDGSRAAEVR